MEAKMLSAKAHTRVTRHRGFKKSFLLTTASMAAALSLVACGGSNGGGAASGDTSQLIVGQVAEPKSLDPSAVTAVNDFRLVVNMYDGLVRYSADSLDVEPALASDWEVSDDGKTYTFHLRDDVTFHDGTPFNADAVKYTFDRMLVDDAPGSDAGPFPLADQYFGEVESVTVVDDHTVTFELNDVFAPFLSNLAYPTGLIVPPSSEESDSFGQNPVGTGAFKFAEWEANQKVVLEANDEYWDGDVASETLVFRPLTDASARISALQSGDVHTIFEVPSDNVTALESNEYVEVLTEAGPAVWFLILNTAEGPFESTEMRQAVNYAIDKEAIVEDLLNGTATVAQGPIAPAFGEAYDDSLEGYPYDPDKAQELMAEAGYADGADVTFYVTESGSGMLEPKQMGESIQAQLKEVGINAEINTFEWNTYLDKVNAGLEGEADMAEMAWMTNDPGVLPGLTLHSGSMPADGGFNSGYYENAEVDALIDQTETATDPDERNQLFHELQQVVVEDAPWLFVANGALTVGSLTNVSGMNLHPSSVIFFKDAVITE